jgi:SagB-type dehydrogenase family enzyme
MAPLQPGAMERTLPRVQLDSPFPLVRAIALRRSIRSFSSEPISASDLGMLLWSCQGITDEAEGFRAAPSAGGIFPIHTYVILPEGVFRYAPREHALAPMMDRDIRSALARASLDQQFIAAAPLTIGLAGDRRLVSRRYGERARRYLDMEAGHIAQNLHLMAVALGLGSVAVGAFDDNAVSRLLDLSSGFDPLYLLPVGRQIEK